MCPEAASSYQRSVLSVLGVYMVPCCVCTAGVCPLVNVCSVVTVLPSSELMFASSVVSVSWFIFSCYKF